MPTPRLVTAAALALGLILGACSSGPAGQGSQGPGAGTPVPGATSGNPLGSGPLAGEPCSFLTAAQVGAVIGTTPVEVQERPNRGDCDYWLTAAKDTKVNVGVTTGPDAAPLFENTKGLGQTAPVSLGDEAYSMSLAELGTLVMVRKGDSVVAVQVLTKDDAAKQLVQATALAQAVLAAL